MEGITVWKQPKDDIENLLDTPCCDSFLFSDKEREVLKLWDQAEDLRIEQALLEAQNEAQPIDNTRQSDDLDAQLEAAQNNALEARAAYVLRNRIVQQALITDPILKAVHTGADGVSLSQRMLGLVNERDVLAMVNSKLSKDIQTASIDLTAVERQNTRLVTTNQGLAASMVALAQDLQEQKTDDIEDPDLRGELQRLDREVRRARRDRRIMKSVVSALIVGSGIDWARDEVLTDLVLDDEDEGE